MIDRLFSQPLPESLALFALTILWQSTALLAAGLLLAFLCRRRSALAHRVLLAACVATVIAPIVTEMGRQRNWGLLTAAKPDDVPETKVATAPPEREVQDPLRSAAENEFRSFMDAPSEDRNLPANRPIPTSPSSDAPANVPAPLEVDATPNAAAEFLSWPGVLLALWSAVSSILLLRLTFSMARGLLAARRAVTVNSPEMSAALLESRRRCGVQRPIALLTARFAVCPLLWAWGRKPAIIVPSASSQQTLRTIDWTAVFCHELAHWIRRDHWSSLFVSFLAATIAWNPLIWIARRWMETLAEEACDDWAVSLGCHATDYAESLVNLVPMPRPGFALAAVSRSSTLAARIRRLLSARLISPRVGYALAATILLATLALTTTLVLAQPGKKENDPAPSVPDSATVFNPEKEADDSPDKLETFHGTVKLPDGKLAKSGKVSFIQFPYAKFQSTYDMVDAPKRLFSRLARHWRSLPLASIGFERTRVLPRARSRGAMSLRRSGGGWMPLVNSPRTWRSET